MQNIHNLKMKIKKLDNEIQELINLVDQLQEESEKPLTLDTLKKVSIDRLTYLGQKIKNNEISEIEKEEWRLIGDWLESITPMQTKEGKERSEIENIKFNVNRE